MQHPNNDFIKRIVKIERNGEFRTLPSKKDRLDIYNVRQKLSEKFDQNSEKHIFEISKVLTETTTNKPSENTQHLYWQTVVTQYGTFYYNKDTDMWMNMAGMMSHSFVDLIHVSDFSFHHTAPIAFNTPAINDITITTSLVNIYITDSLLSVVIPTLIANNIKYGHTLGFEVGSDYLNSYCCGFNPTLYATKVQNFVADYQSRSSASAYNSYFGNIPEYLTLNPIGYVGGPEIQELIPVDSDIFDLDTIAGKAFKLVQDLLAKTKEIIPQSIISQFSVPFLQFNFLFGAGDSCTWSYRRPGVTVAQYEAEKARLLNLLRIKVEQLLPYSDAITTRNYSAYTQSFMHTGSSSEISTIIEQSQLAYTQYNSKIVDYATTKPARTYVCPIVFQGGDYLLYNLNNGDTSLPEDQLRANVNALPTLVYDKYHTDALLLNPIKQAGIKSIHLWAAWEYVATIAARPFVHSTVADFTDLDIYYNRKLINDLFSVTGFSSSMIPLNDHTSWQNSQVKTTVMQAALAKDIEMATSFRNL